MVYGRRINVEILHMYVCFCTTANICKWQRGLPYTFVICRMASIIHQSYDQLHRGRFMADEGRVFDQLHLRSGAVHEKVEYDERYTEYIRKTELLPFISLVSRSMPKMNPCAITTLVDWWRPETHTFHFYAREMTVTLQDVSLITALP